KMRERGLTPNREADPRTFIRRATFDLHGLPPTLEEVRQFERECREDRNAAVERLVDRLMKSPRYGERWGRHWLDIAHYADTHGFERDQIRPHAWRYRDYVINALNDDLPYDIFLKQQIAGDVIAPDDPKSVIATGFLAAGPWDFVGQVETRSDILRRAARASDLDDIVTQVMTATMGLTINCARCHDHKLDPISQEEYYRLTAVFAGVKRGERDASRAEVQQLADRKRHLTAQLAKTRAELAQLSGGGWSLADIVGGGDGSGTGVKDRGIDLRDGRPITEKLGYHRELTANRLQKVAPPDGARVQPIVKHVFVPDGRGTVLIDDDLPIKGVPPTSVHFWDAIRNGSLNSQVSTRLADIDFATAGHSILGLHANGGITFDLTQLHAPTAKPISGFKFTAQLGFGAGPGGAGTLADFSVYVDQELKFQKLKLKKDETFSLEIPVPLGTNTLTLIATDGGDGIGHDLLFLGDARLVPQRPESQMTDTEKQRIDELQRAVAQLEKSLADLPTPARVFAIVTESPPEVRVLQRGNPEAAQQAVSPGVPSCVKHSPLDLSDAASPEGERRRKLADWIAHPDNPLTRRVIVNRLWHHHFGQGLVNTPSDFGYGGDRGSHPELLDWLAEDLLRSNWSLKKMHKTIMLSAAYRQASAIVPEHARIDNGNRLLWRQNTRRLDAESLRDAVLFTTGKLNLEMGGPGYRDFNY
ncbi:MAG TPA: DUF1549 domain-containing protein, partial [Pirellulaceae bacterium]|nr:DUF1549 domain-containing protein [Pirellulaceae bacterium]